jgi:hypothetical protein
MMVDQRTMMQRRKAAFEAAVAAVSLAIKEGHEIHVSVPGREGEAPPCR